MNPTIKNYHIDIAWDDEEGCFFARVPAIPGCMSHGATPEEAARNIGEALDGVLESLEAGGFPLPEPDLALDELRRFAPVINISALARRAGVNKHTLASKLRRGTRFTDDEATKIRRALVL